MPNVDHKTASLMFTLYHPCGPLFRRIHYMVFEENQKPVARAGAQELSQPGHQAGFSNDKIKT